MIDTTTVAAATVCVAVDEVGAVIEMGGKGGGKGGWKGEKGEEQNKGRGEKGRSGAGIVERSKLKDKGDASV